MEFQTKQIENQKIRIKRDFSKIKSNKNLIDTYSKSIDWVTELPVDRNNADSSSDLFLKKIQQLINLWVLFQNYQIKIKNCKKTS